MTSIPEEVRQAFAGQAFGPPCEPGEVDEAEWSLGQGLPGVLRDLYAAFDGFDGPTSTSFFYPLIRPRPHGWTTLVERTLTLRAGEEYPAFFRRALAVGDDGCGGTLVLFPDDPGPVFLWHPSDGEDPEPAGPDLPAAWREMKRLYDDLDPGQGRSP